MQLRAGRVYLGLWIQREESRGEKAWQQVGMVAQGKGESSYLELQTQSRFEKTRNDGGGTLNC